MRCIVSFVIAILGTGCGGMGTDDPPEPLRLDSIDPTTGGVAGGTSVHLTGAGLTSDIVVAVGGVACGNVTIADQGHATCTTGDVAFKQGPADVVVTRGSDTVMLAGAFTFNCPWQTRSGKTTCGAIPPVVAPEQNVDTWVTQFQGDHGFVATAAGGAANMADTSEFVLGTQSVFVSTSGFGGAPSTIAHTNMPAVDLSGHMVKIWIRVDNVAHASAVDVVLGDSNFANNYTFTLMSSQGQQWITDGDWVSFTVSWDNTNITQHGAPNRSAITDVMFRVTDDAMGSPVRLHANGIGLVPTPDPRYPGGVVTFTFDDNWATMVSQGAPILAAHGFPATAYVIVDRVGLAGRASLAELHSLDASGWDIASHAFTDVDHGAMFTTLPPSVVENDMVSTREWLIEQGFGGYDHCAYPSGEYLETTGTDVLSIANLYFTSCRTIYSKQLEAYPPSDARKLRVFYAKATATLADAKSAVDAARANGDWLIFVNHQLVTTPLVSTDWAITDYTALVDYVAQSGLAVDTVSGILGHGSRAAPGTFPASN